MYGPSPAPPPGSSAVRAGRVVLRVVFFAVSLGSIGFLSWVPPLVLAIRTRRLLDWLCAVAVTGLVISATVLLDESSDDSDWQTNAGMAILLFLALAAPVYHLIGDLRRAQAADAAAARDFGMNLPPGVNPYALGVPVTPPYPVAAYPAAPAPVPLPQPPPAGPGRSERIDQVRAELDELSSYLREQESGG
jgi:hypothetical protein